MHRVGWIVLVAACGSSIPDLRQRGVAPRPQMATWDGRRLETDRAVRFYGEAGSPQGNVGGAQGGAEVRFRHSDRFETALSADAAVGVFGDRDKEASIGPAVGLGGAVRSSRGDGNIGIFASAHVWRVPVTTTSGSPETVWLFRPTFAAGFVAGPRLSETVTLFLGLGVLASITIPNTRKPGEMPRAVLSPGAIVQAGLKLDIASATALLVYGSASKTSREFVDNPGEAGWYGGGAGIELGF